MASIEKEAKTVEEAVSLGLVQLGLTENEVDIEVIRKGGILKTALVKLTTKYTLIDRIFDHTKNILDYMGINCSVDIGEREGGYDIELSGADSAFAIGYRGEVLDAIQYLILIDVNKGREEYIRIVVDAEGYRAKRINTLTNLAIRLADKALRTGQAIELEPMNTYERKIVHEALSKNSQINTISQGTEPNRYIIIQPKNREKSYGTNHAFRKNGLKTKSFGAKQKRF